MTYDATGWPLTCGDAETTQCADEMPIAEKVVASRRLVRTITPRRTAWLDWTTGRYVLSDAGAGHIGERAQLVDVLDIGARQIYLIGPRPGDTLEGWNDWRRAPDGWHDAGSWTEVSMLPVLRFIGPERQRVDVQRAAAWLGESMRPDPIDARDGWQLADRLLGQSFGGARVLSTAATTGREAFARTIRFGVEYPVQSAEVQELIRSTSGQGRMEVLRWDGVDEAPGLVEYDGRRMYSALVDDLPIGPAELHKGDRFTRFAPGRFRCTWTVPAGWSHVGLLPAPTVDGWQYPRRPGERGAGWVDAWELQLARECGWTVDVTESLVYPPKPVDVPGPLNLWGARLRDCAHRAEQTGDTPRARVASALLRAVVLHGIGAFVGRGHTTSGSVPLADADTALPAGAAGLRLEGDHVAYAIVHAAAWPEMVHPEWSAAIWARARVRLLDSPTGRTGVRGGALHVHPAQVVAFRTDAVYLTHDPGWVDDGKPGRLRHKPGPNERTAVPWPRNTAELLRLRSEPYDPGAHLRAARTAARAAKRGAR